MALVASSLCRKTKKHKLGKHNPPLSLDPSPLPPTLPLPPTRSDFTWATFKTEWNAYAHLASAAAAASGAAW